MISHLESSQIGRLTNSRKSRSVIADYAKSQGAEYAARAIASGERIHGHAVSLRAARVAVAIANPCEGGAL